MHVDRSVHPQTFASATTSVEATARALPWQPQPIEPAGPPAASPLQPTLPDYLVRHYWWAYLWRPAVWFFDHQPIIDAIVFGQYRKLTGQVLRLLDPPNSGSTLLIASAYGTLIPELAARLDHNRFTVVDVAPIQLERARMKLERAGLAERVQLARMNAEALRFDDSRFDSALLFLLLHELPVEARRRALTEAVRVIGPGGRLVLAEYGADAGRHPFHRWAPLRWIFGAAEPFLPSLWKQDLDGLLDQCAAAAGKRVVRGERASIFGGFYRVNRYRVEQA